MTGVDRYFFRRELRLFLRGVLAVLFLIGFMLTFARGQESAFTQLQVTIHQKDGGTIELLGENVGDKECEKLKAAMLRILGSAAAETMAGHSLSCQPEIKCAGEPVYMIEQYSIGRKHKKEAHRIVAKYDCKSGCDKVTESLNDLLQKRMLGGLSGKENRYFCASYPQQSKP